MVKPGQKQVDTDPRAVRNAWRAGVGSAIGEEAWADAIADLVMDEVRADAGEITAEELDESRQYVAEQCGAKASVLAGARAKAITGVTAAAVATTADTAAGFQQAATQSRRAALAGHPRHLPHVALVAARVTSARAVTAASLATVV